MYIMYIYKISKVGYCFTSLFYNHYALLILSSLNLSLTLIHLIVHFKSF